MPTLHLSFARGESPWVASERFLREHEIPHTTRETTALANALAFELDVPPKKALQKAGQTNVPLRSLSPIAPEWSLCPPSPQALRCYDGSRPGNRGTWRAHNDWHARTQEYLERAWRGQLDQPGPKKSKEAEKLFKNLALRDPTLKRLLTLSEDRQVWVAIKRSLERQHPKWKSSKIIDWADRAHFGIQSAGIDWNQIRSAHRQLSEYLLNLTDRFPAHLSLVVDLHLGANETACTMLGDKWSLAKIIHHHRQIRPKKQTLTAQVGQNLGRVNAILDATEDCLLRCDWTLDQWDTIDRAYGALYDTLVIPFNKKIPLRDLMTQLGAHQATIRDTVEKLWQRGDDIERCRTPLLSEKFTRLYEASSSELQQKYASAYEAATELNERPHLKPRHQQLSELIQTLSALHNAQSKMTPIEPPELETEDEHLRKNLTRYASALHLWNKHAKLTPPKSPEQPSEFARRLEESTENISNLTCRIDAAFRIVDPQQRVLSEFQAGTKVLFKNLLRRLEQAKWDILEDLAHRVNVRINETLTKLFKHQSRISSIPALAELTPAEQTQLIKEIQSIQSDVKSFFETWTSYLLPNSSERLCSQAILFKSAFRHSGLATALKENDSKKFQSLYDFMEEFPSALESLLNSPEHDVNKESHLRKQLQEILELSASVPEEYSNLSDTRSRLRIHVLDDGIAQFGTVKLHGCEAEALVRIQLDADKASMLSTMTQDVLEALAKVRQGHPTSKRLERAINQLAASWEQWTSDGYKKAPQHLLRDEQTVRTRSQTLSEMTRGEFQIEHLIQTAANMLAKPSPSGQREINRLACINKLLHDSGFNDITVRDFQLRPIGSIALKINRVSVSTESKWIVLDPPNIFRRDNQDIFYKDQIEGVIKIMKARETTKRLKAFWKHPAAYAVVFGEFSKIITS